MSICSTVIHCPKDGVMHISAEVQRDEATGLNVVMIERGSASGIYREFYSVKGAIALSNLLNSLRLPKER